MNKVLLTGASGFIGKCLVPQLCAANYHVIETDIESGDVTDESTWSKFPKADVIIHLAGKSFVPDSWADPTSFIKCNLLGTVAALNYCKKHSAGFIFLSSYLYGNPKILPISEDSCLFVNNPYALSKKMAEDACRFYSDNFGINITILRLFNVFGPGQAANFLIPSIIDQVNSGTVIQVKDLEPKRDYVYINDVVQAIMKSIDHQSKFNIFNIGSGVSYSVEEVIQMIQSIKNTNLPVYSSKERRNDEIMNTVADISKAKLHLGWVPQWTLHQGLHQIINNE